MIIKSADRKQVKIKPGHFISACINSPNRPIKAPALENTHGEGVKGNYPDLSNFSYIGKKTTYQDVVKKYWQPRVFALNACLLPCQIHFQKWHSYKPACWLLPVPRVAKQNENVNKSLCFVQHGRTARLTKKCGRVTRSAWPSAAPALVKTGIRKGLSVTFKNDITADYNATEPRRLIFHQIQRTCHSVDPDTQQKPFFFFFVIKVIPFWRLFSYHIITIRTGFTFTHW